MTTINSSCRLRDFPLGNVFNSNQLVIAFNEDSLRFSAISTFGNSGFRESGIVFARFPYSTIISSSGAYSACPFYNCKNLVGLMFESASSIGVLNYGSTTKYIVLTMQSVPTLAVGRWLVGKIYVLDGLVEDYKGTTEWSGRTILPLSQLPTDYPDCPWLQELREKGIIP